MTAYTRDRFGRPLVAMTVAALITPLGFGAAGCRAGLLDWRGA